MFLGITPVSSVSKGLHFLTLPLVSVMRVIYRKIRHARYLYIKSLGCALSIEKYGKYFLCLSSTKISWNSRNNEVQSIDGQQCETYAYKA